MLFLITSILNIKETDSLLKYLHSHFPIPNLSHLKRLRKTTEAGQTKTVAIITYASVRFCLLPI